MTKYREIFQLASLGLSLLNTIQSVKSSQKTVVTSMKKVVDFDD